jgi:DNA-binding HxlR family transcriptional regulator
MFREAAMRRASAVRQQGEGARVARKRSPTPPARKLPELDRVIHERVRLAIVSSLAANESLSFNELKGLLGTTDGNLSVHARKLEDAGYVALSKSFQKRMPRTEYRLTPAGRRAFERYLAHLEALVRGQPRP